MRRLYLRSGVFGSVGLHFRATRRGVLMTPSYRVAIEAAIILWLLFPLRRLHQTFFRWMGQHPLFAFEVGLLLIILYGAIGSDYGLRELFWHDSAWVQVVAGLDVSALLLLLVALTCSLDGPDNA